MDMVFVWDMDPDLIRIGSFSIRWYGLMFAIAFLAGTLIISNIFKRENKPSESVDRLLIYMLIAVVGGARLGEIVFYNLEYYLKNPLDIFKVWEGGLASHGALIGILIALFIYSRKTPGQPLLWLLDRICIIVASGGALIRIGNFFNSEIIGKPTGSNWGVIFKRIDLIPRHPAQLYESFTYFALFIVLVILYRTVETQKRQGLLVGFFLSVGFSARFAIEFVKENLVYSRTGWPLSTGQVLSVPVIILGIFLLIHAWKNPKSLP